MGRRRGKRSKLKRGPVYQKLDHDLIRALGVARKPTLDYSWRRGAEVNNVPSLVGPSSPSACSIRSDMDLLALSKESASARAATVANSKRIAIAYNKGPYQYITDETDPTSLGRR